MNRLKLISIVAFIVFSSVVMIMSLSRKPGAIHIRQSFASAPLIKETSEINKQVDKCTILNIVIRRELIIARDDGINNNSDWHPEEVRMFIDASIIDTSSLSMLNLNPYQEDLHIEIMGKDFFYP